MTGAVIIERRTFGFGVVTEPANPHLRKAFVTRNRNRAFLMAAGYASTLAARYELQLIDRTERLSEEDCRALVEAQREEMASKPRLGVIEGGLHRAD